MESAHLATLNKRVIYFLIGYYNKSKECQFSSVSQSCPTLCEPTDCSMPGSPSYHQQPEPTQVHVHWVGEVMWPSHPLSSPSPPAFNPTLGSFPVSQFFASGGQSIGVSASASILPMNIQHWFPLGWTGWIFLQSKEFSTVFSITAVQKHQFFRAQFYL